jgi:hypothetical protein
VGSRRGTLGTNDLRAYNRGDSSGNLMGMFGWETLLEGGFEIPQSRTIFASCWEVYLVDG